MKSKKGKAIRRISILATLVLLIGMALGVSVMAETNVVVGDSCYYADLNADNEITKEDAVYLLYHSIFGEELYPLVDFEYEGEITVLDALKILSQIGKGGTTIHAYNEPEWVWEAGGAKAVFSCACGKGEQFEKTAKVELYEDEEYKSKKETCAESGYVFYRASVDLTDDCKKVSEPKRVDVSATGKHTFAADSVKCEDRACTECGHVEEAVAHEYVEVAKTTATCTEAATITYDCNVCHDAEFTVSEGEALGHSYGDAVETKTANCHYTEVYTCSVCKDIMEGESYERHNLSSSIIKEATCSTTGTKRTTCAGCGEHTDEDIATVADAHSWNEGTEQGDMIVYTCEEETCTKTRTAMNFTKKAEAKVDSKALAEVKEIDINGASLTLDADTAKNLAGEVEIKAEKTSASELKLDNGAKLDAEVQKQIGTNPVYNFSITDANGAVGKEKDSIEITISIPYELQPKDDPDCIDIWFINDKGEVNVEKGTYANGAVTFTATHFSYYTVTRLTPAERCAAYGHNDSKITVAPTCTEDGYELHACSRCNKSWKDNIVEKLGHTNNTTTTPATCTTAGKTVVACEKCNYKTTTTIPATGHDWNAATGESKCTGNWTEEVGCKSCGATKNVVHPQAPHKTVTVPHAATCVDKGYDETTCENCTVYDEETGEVLGGYRVVEYTAPATGHTYDTEWAWDNDGKEATVTFTCTNDGCDDTFTEDGTVSITKELKVSCEKDGYIDYIAKFIYNRVLYSETYHHVIPATGHNEGTDWLSDAVHHFHGCAYCDEKLSKAEHSFGAAVQTKAPNCTEEGENVYTCTICDYEKIEVIPAEGHDLDEHNICKKCGDGCDHSPLIEKEEQILVNGTKAGVVDYALCGCGKNTYFLGYDFHSNSDIDESYVIDENGYAKFTIVSDLLDYELNINEVLTWDIDEENCVGTQYMDLTITTDDGEEVFDLYAISADGIAHPNAVYGTPDDMKSEYNMCAGTTTFVHCPCGQDEMLIMDLGCHFEEIGGKEGETTEVCTACGVTRVNTYGSEKIGQCRVRCYEEYAYYRDNEELVSYDYSFEMMEHNSEYTFDIAQDATCSDGYTVYEKCKDCGFEGSYYEKPREGEHYTYYELLDVSAYNLCGGMKEIETWRCPCGEIANANLSTATHNNEIIYQNQSSDGTLVSVGTKCKDCGLTADIEQRVNRPESGCEYQVEASVKFSVSGKEIFTTHSLKNMQQHDAEVIHVKLNGDSCTDGGTITYMCNACEKVWEDSIRYHDRVITKTYDLSEYGGCAGEVTLYSCACGEESWVKENTYCDWDFVNQTPVTEKDENGNTVTIGYTNRYECSVCGLINDWTYYQGETDGCYTYGKEVYEYIKPGNVNEVVISLKCTSINTNHDWTYDFDIAPGASCDDGFTVTKTCKKCGETDSWDEEPDPGEHVRYRIQSYNMKEYGFCEGRADLYACPCGETSGFDMEMLGCDWEYYSGEGEDVAFKCAMCGGIRQSIGTSKELGGCLVERAITHKFYENSTHFENGIVAFSASTKEVMESHDNIYSFDIADGATCSDGYTVTKTCKKCGATDSWEDRAYPGDHDYYVVESFELPCGGFVEQMVCPCGESSSYSWDIYRYCEFQYVEDGDYEVCLECGTKMITSHMTESVDKCHERDVYTVSFYAHDGTFIGKASEIDEYEMHDDAYVFRATDGNCEKGYTVTRTCQTCGDVRVETGNSHDLFEAETTSLTDYGMCGGTKTLLRCACGQVQKNTAYANCRWNPPTYNPNTQEQTQTCGACGATRIERNFSYKDEESCMMYTTLQVKMYAPNGDEVAAYENTHSMPSHSFIYTFNMNGTSCEDGYTVNRKCINCDYKWEDTTIYKSHSDWLVETVDLAEKGLCGATLRHWQCACEERNYWDEVDVVCNRNWSEGPGISVCENCGTKRIQESNDSVVDDCHTRWTYTTNYIKDKEVIFNITYSNISDNHDVVFTLSLNNPGTTCMQGYTATGTCSRCQETVTTNGYSHETFVVEKTDLADDGLCANSAVYKYSCACGSRTEMNDWNGCNWNYEGATSFSYSWDYTPATDNTYTYSFDVATADAYRCYGCNGVKYIAKGATEKDAQCNAIISNANVYTNANGAFAADYITGYKGYDHKYVFTGEVTMNGTSCEDGYSMTYRCTDCGNSYQQHGWGHRSELKDTVDLSSWGVCAGAYKQVYGCYCGQNDDSNYNFPSCSFVYTDKNYVDEETGIEHSVWISKCSTCGLMRKQDTEYIDDIPNCKRTEVTTYTYSINGVLLEEPRVHSWKYEHHDLEETCTLADGAKDCGGGVNVVQECRICDFKDAHMTYGHYQFKIESWDLEDYGSECGGNIVHKVCACGYFDDFMLENMKCDMDRQKIGESVEEYPYQAYSIWSGTSFCRTEYLRKCAVTNPEKCGFAIYETNYNVWDKENCTMISYTEWKLGSNDTGTSYEGKPIVFETGRNLYHDYETTTSADGSTVTKTCKNCQSTHVTTETYDDVTNIEVHEQAFNHTIDIESMFGYPKTAYSLQERIYVNGYDYTLKDYTEQTYFNQPSSKVFKDYTYDWENFDCTAICTTTDANGNVTTKVVPCHKGNWHNVYEENANCSQISTVQYVCDCKVCNTTFVESEWETIPGHAWCWTGIDDIHECSRCGLESISGSTGSVVIEDMSDDYGNDANYVIGYYMYNGVLYDYELLVSYNGEEIPLNNINYVEMTRGINGIQAITFDKAEANAAAEAALANAGYTNVTDFALTFVFYPEYNDWDLDYAITLTDKSIAE